VSLADRCRRFVLCETLSSYTSSYPDRCAKAHRPRCLACMTAATGDSAPSNPRARVAELESLGVIMSNIEFATLLVVAATVSFLVIRAFHREARHWDRVAMDLANAPERERERVLSHLHRSERKKVLQRLSREQR